MCRVDVRAIGRARHAVAVLGLVVVELVAGKDLARTVALEVHLGVAEDAHLELPRMVQVCLDQHRVAVAERLGQRTAEVLGVGRIVDD